MLTFQQIRDDAAIQTEDSSAEALALFGRAINQGLQKFGAIINREVKVVSGTFSTAPNTTIYHLPVDCIRPKAITITVGNTNYPLRECPTQEDWDNLQRVPDTSDTPEYFYCLGSDQYGIWPTPASANPGVIRYEKRTKRLSALDIVAGTITITNNTVTVTGTGMSTTWVTKVIGRSLILTDSGDQDGVAYKILDRPSTSTLTLAVPFAGTTVISGTYIIGEVPDIPEEFHESLVDYALYRYYKRRRDRGMAADCKAAFDEQILICQENYSSMTSSNYIPPRSRRPGPGRISFNRDLKVQ